VSPSFPAFVDELCKIKEAASAQELYAAARRLAPTRSRGLAGQLGATLIPTKAHIRKSLKHPEFFEWQRGMIPEELVQALQSRYGRHAGRIFYGPSAAKGLLPGVEGRGPKTLLTLHEGLERKAVPLGKSLHLSPGVLVEELNLLNRLAAPKGQAKSLRHAARRLREMREATGETELLRQQFAQVFKDPRAHQFLESGQRVPAAMKRRFLRGAKELPEMSPEQAGEMAQRQARHIMGKTLTQSGRAGRVEGIFG